MSRRKAYVWDDRPARPESLLRETAETLSGPGPCARCRSPKFDHAPTGGIGHEFVPMDPIERAARAAVNEERLKRERRGRYPAVKQS